MRLQRQLNLKYSLPLVLVLILVLPYLIPDRESEPLDEQARHRLSGRFIQLSDGYTHYRLEGPEEGLPVVLVHGFSTPLFNWDHTVPVLVQAGFRVLRYDLYGRGFSDRPHLDYTKDLFSRQLLELLNVLNINRPVYLVGLSMGGAVAVIFAARHPERVGKLALFAPAGFPVNIPLTGKLVRLPVLGSYLLRAVGDRSLITSVRKALYAPDKHTEYISKYKEQMVYHGYKRALASTLRHFNLSNQATEFKKAGLHPRPVKLFWGRSDRIVPFENSTRVIAAMPRATLEALPAAGHVLPYENAAQVNPVLVAFLEAGS